ncbi:hypothetical protein [Thermoflexibacter ruber]|uniref:Uncharacterized protein n=1 Tax=Thermoflexibacter ruber TaxID=1003 RepID=A0A1I2H0H0_9BACT|nr:hypothetical protein [Thermoflexibacter ruber]SFF22903.1 hypothetical protein SAMN04488541_10218 [Thermoflexibacter ruber]
MQSKHFIWANITWIGLFALYQIFSFEPDEVIGVLPWIGLHTFYFFILVKFIAISARLVGVIWIYAILLILIISFHKLLGFISIEEMNYGIGLIALLFGFYLLSQSHLLKKYIQPSPPTPDVLEGLRKVLVHIDNADLEKAFATLDHIGVQNSTFSKLKKEFISGKQGFDFEDRFKTAINELIHSQ